MTYKNAIKVNYLVLYFLNFAYLLPQLSRTAVKDYNRGRTYLIDQANKEGILIFKNIQEAVECVINKCRTR